MSAPILGRAPSTRAIGLACVCLGAWLTLASVGLWALDRLLPPGAAPALLQRSLGVASELAVHAWPLAIVVVGLALALVGAREPRLVGGRGRGRP